jgi:hypothetical protein
MYTDEVVWYHSFWGKRDGEINCAFNFIASVGET